MVLSLPSRERGLKFVKVIFRSLIAVSLPSRERGLKSRPYLYQLRYSRVAPFAGAWIEINPFDKVIKPKRSLPSRERGLK